MAGKVIVGICEHGFNMFGHMESHASEDEKREMASGVFKLVLADSVTFNGRCEVCTSRYKDNCKTLGIEP